jgi:hypothetical protein
MQPGIMEAPYGTMYVVSGKDIKTYFKKYGIKHINAHNIKKAIIHYYFKKQGEPKNDDEFIFD